MNDESQEQSKIQIDSDWKAEAKKEKERLAEQAREAADEGGATGPGGRQLPPADMKGLISQLVSQAMLYMGMIPDPGSGQRVFMPDLAKHSIDLLGVLEEKTKGNLDEEEEEMISGAAGELRMAFLEMKKRAEQQMAQQAQQAEQSAGEQQKGQSGGGGIELP